MRAIVAASPSIPDWMSPAAADFIRAALQRTPARRSAVAALLEHPWVTGHIRWGGFREEGAGGRCWEGGIVDASLN